ncbi:MAG TPA: ABC transporter ATP-binding protein, partial [Planctomycetaceae bacterium]|nr:ABC transporter ATP-binding protein [Planctomycetaceae bacterium]
FDTEEGTVKAVDGLSIRLEPRRTLGLVGESGSGKSVTSLSILRLLPDVGARIAAGRIAFLGRDLVQLPIRDMRQIRGRDISMIFQEPGTSLNPVYRVGDQVMEAMRQHQSLSKAAARKKTIDLFREVGIPEPERRVDSYPHEMSGGQKQRVMIAMALSCGPKLLIADEPTTALDVTIQKQILDLIRRLQAAHQMAVLFITHDLGVIAEVADDVAVMYRGQLVEYGPVLDIFRNPQHPYTKGLLACRPRLDLERRRLPTVADYMQSSTAADGTVSIIVKPLTPERLKEIEGRGRGRLLHPQRELDRLGIALRPQDQSAGTQLVPDSERPLLKVENLKVYYPIKTGLLRRVTGYVKAVDGISFEVYRGQTLGLVGESGCGKTTAGRAILRLLPITEGHIEFENADWRALHGAELRKQRRKMQIVFQDPYSSLNPRLTVEDMLTEAMAVHRIGRTPDDRRDRAAALLDEVGLPSAHLRRYPHEFSGGQRQRLGIARALAVEPEFLVCDESVSALDVSVQAQVLNLLKDLQERRGLTYIFISHDLSVVKFMADMMAVMNAGKIVEFGPSEQIYAQPQDDYTKRLIAAIPQVSLDAIERRMRSRAP